MRCNPSAVILATLLLATSTAVAQDTDPAHRRASDANMNDREFLHPKSNPVDLRGIDQGPDGFRSGTPALQNADTTVALVDLDELRERRLSLYAGAPKFDRPVARRDGRDDDEEPLAKPLRIDEPADDDGVGPGGVALVTLLAAACGGAAVWVLRRR